MSNKETGGPAFPPPLDVSMLAALGPDNGALGMTLRDHFAGLAMAIVPNQSAYNMRTNETNEHYIARRAYEYADAMLKARK